MTKLHKTLTMSRSVLSSDSSEKNQTTVSQVVSLPIPISPFLSPLPLSRKFPFQSSLPTLCPLTSLSYHPLDFTPETLSILSKSRLSWQPRREGTLYNLIVQTFNSRTSQFKRLMADNFLRKGRRT